MTVQSVVMMRNAIEELVDLDLESRSHRHRLTVFWGKRFWAWSQCSITQICNAHDRTSDAVDAALAALVLRRAWNLCVDTSS